MSDVLSLFIPLEKVDEEKHEIWGRATQEVPDSANEVMDYATSLPYFLRWSDAASKRSGGKSKGNLRAMHQPIAAGKLLELVPNEGEKAIDIGVKVTDENEWQKVLDGTYTGFSVGGKYARRWSDMSNPGRVKYTADPMEISLVDAPAVPTATFALVKADGTIEHRPFKHTAAIEAGDVLVSSGSSRSLAAGTDDSQYGKAAGPQPGDVQQPPEWVTQFTGVIEKFGESVELLATLRKLEAEEQKKTLKELEQRGSSIGISRRDGGPLTFSKGLSSDWHLYGDPANWSWACDDPSRCKLSLAKYNEGSGKEMYQPREWNILGRRIARLASDVFGVKYSFSPKDKRVERIEKTMSALSKADPAGLLRDVRSQLGQAVDAIGSDPDAAKNLLTQALAALDVAADTETASTGDANPKPPVTQEEGTLAAAAGVATPSTPSTAPSSSSSSSSGPTATTKGTTPTETTPTTVTAAATPSTPSTPTTASPVTAGAMPDAYKAQMDLMAADIAKLTGLISKLLPVEKADGDPKPAAAVADPTLVQAQVPVPATVAPAPAAKAAPLGDLNSLVPAAPKADDALTLLAAGGPNAYRKAVEAAGGEAELQKRVTEAVVKSIHAGGVATAERFKVIDLSAS